MSRPESFWLPRDAGTLRGFRRWATSDCFPEGLRATYDRGEMFLDMLPERAGSHNAVKSAVNRTLDRLIEAADSGTWYPDGMLVTHEAAEFSGEPDGMYVFYDYYQSGRVRETPTADGQDCAELLGTPDMVLEIVSPSSSEKDLKRMRDRYHAAGIPEYWVIDARRGEVEFEILRLEPAGYQSAPAGADGWLRSPVFGREFRLTRRKNRIDRWRYTLEERP